MQTSNIYYANSFHKTLKEQGNILNVILLKLDRIEASLNALLVRMDIHHKSWKASIFDLEEEYQKAVKNLKRNRTYETN